MARLPGGGEAGATARPSPKGQPYHAVGEETAQSPTGREAGPWPRAGGAAGTQGSPAAQTSRPLRPHPCPEPPPNLQSILALHLEGSTHMEPGRPASPLTLPPSKLDSRDTHRAPWSRLGQWAQACRGRPGQCQRHLEPSAGQDDATPAPRGAHAAGTASGPSPAFTPAFPPCPPAEGTLPPQSRSTSPESSPCLSSQPAAGPREKSLCSIHCPAAP